MADGAHWGWAGSRTVQGRNQAIGFVRARLDLDRAWEMKEGPRQACGGREGFHRRALSQWGNADEARQKAM